MCFRPAPTPWTRPGRRFPGGRFPDRPREIKPVQPLRAPPAPLLPLIEGDFPEDDQWNSAH